MDSNQRFQITKRKILLASFYIVCSLGVVKFLQAVYVEQDGELPFSYIVVFCITAGVFVLAAVHHFFNHQTVEIAGGHLVVKKWAVFFRFEKKIEVKSINRVRLIKEQKGYRGREVGFNAGLWHKSYSTGDFRKLIISRKGETIVISQLNKDQGISIYEAIQKQKEQLVTQ